MFAKQAIMKINLTTINAKNAISLAKLAVIFLLAHLAYPIPQLLG